MTIMAGIHFDQVVSRGCGMDIHKKVVVATVQGEGICKETKSFDTFTSSLTQLREWLVSLGITHVAMESTGVYWKPIYNVFEDYIRNIWIVNARHIKNVPGHKTDKNDSEWICQLLMAGLLKPSFIPPREQRELRDLTRYRRKLIETVSANKNRIIRTLEDGNVKLSSVLSDTSGSTATKLIGKKKSGRTSHGDKHVRATLVEAAWAASRTKGTFFMERFNRLAPRKGNKKALIAVGHSLLKCIHYVLSTGGRYKELGDSYVPEKKEKQRKEYLKGELKKLGYHVVLTKKKD